MYILGGGAPSIYRTTLSIHFFSKNTIGIDTWRSFADTWLGVHTWQAVHTWPVTTWNYQHSSSALSYFKHTNLKLNQSICVKNLQNEAKPNNSNSMDKVTRRFTN